MIEAERLFYKRKDYDEWKECLEMKKVMLWGSYDQGNFGDDLMAAVFSAHLRQQGAHPLVYGMSGSQAGIERVHPDKGLLQAIDEVEICVVGGGEFLFKDNLPRRLLRRHPRQFEAQCRELFQVCTALGRKIIAVSIGGDGTTQARQMSPARRDLFSSSACAQASVRLPDDLAIMADAKVAAQCFPDILLATPKFYPMARASGQRRDRFRIGINLHARYYREIAGILADFSSKNKDVEFSFFVSHQPQAGHNYEVSSDGRLRGGCAYVYRDLRSYCEALATVDVMLSSKLHVGVVAAAYGASFISLAGKPKAKRFVEDVVRHNAAPDVARTISLEDSHILLKALHETLVSWRSGREARTSRIASIADLQAQSLGHLSMLDQAIF